MDLPLLPIVDNSHVHVSGDVIIDPQAAIAPGTIIQAAPDSQIIIRAGACIGMGSIIQSYQGTIEIETGAVLGAGVLVIGQGKIGSHACVGTATTIFAASIQAQEIVPPGSLIGDPSRQVALESCSEVPESEELESSSPTPEPEENTTNSDQIESEPEAIESSETVEEEQTSPPSEIQSETSEDIDSNSPEKEANSSIYGSIHVSRLLLTIFPEGQSFNHRQDPPESE